MGIAHASLPIFGVQFHPESIESTFGKRILRNFMEIS
jgi:anthranilate/para-aminobenzoate synthase component II